MSYASLLKFCVRTIQPANKGRYTNFGVKFAETRAFFHRSHAMAGRSSFIFLAFVFCLLQFPSGSEPVGIRAAAMTVTIEPVSISEGDNITFGVVLTANDGTLALHCYFAY
jgi:hypothetical protein